MLSRSLLITTALLLAPVFSHAADSEQPWRALPLITNGKVDDSWVHVGHGVFVVDGGTLRTEPAAVGLGLLVYKKERLGNCQIRVVFKAKEAKSNSGVYVRIGDGILDQVNKPGASFERDAAGKPSAASMEAMKASAEREEGPWFPVHRGFEVQIADAGNPLHRTGSIYSLSSSAAVSKKEASEWKTMVITLAGTRILVDVDGERITTFDSEKAQRSGERQWFEPKLDQKRPEVGYIGLQTHDPGDIVWFKEVSTRPLPASVK